MKNYVYIFLTAAFGLLASVASAQVPTTQTTILEWTASRSYTNGVSIPATVSVTYKLYSGGKGFVPSATATPIWTGSALTATVVHSKDTPCFQVFAVATLGAAVAVSDASGEVCAGIPMPPSNLKIISTTTTVTTTAVPTN